MDASKDYYAILGLTPSADDIVIRAAYKALAQRYHPDRTKERPEMANSRMAEINEAHAVLGDAKRRKEYDELRGGTKNGESASQENVEEPSGVPRQSPQDPEASDPIPQYQVIPWTRFFARCIDFSLAWTLVFIGDLLLFSADIYIADNLFIDLAMWALVHAAVYVLLETILVSSFSTTPGKSLLGLHIVFSGTSAKIPFYIAFKRTIRVWGYGLWFLLGFPVATIVSMYINYQHLKKHGITTWDKEAGTSIDYKPVNSSRQFVGASLGIAALSAMIIVQIPLRALDRQVID